MKARQIASPRPTGLILVESKCKHTLDSQLYDQISLAKNNFRRKTSTAHSVLHSADNFAESWAVFSTLLNNTSGFSTLSRMSVPQSRGFFSLHGIPDLLASIDQYWSFALTSTSAMKAYGLDIAPSDLDLVCHHSSLLSPIYGHASQQEYYPLSQDECACNMSYCYHHMGVRVLKPSIIHYFKSARGELKDNEHLMLTSSLLSGQAEPPFKFNLHL